MGFSTAISARDIAERRSLARSSIGHGDDGGGDLSMTHSAPEGMLE
jgi:hypothetical protein